MLVFYKKINKLSKKIDKLAKKLEAKTIAEYINLKIDTKELIWKNFVSGISKGIGIAIGFTVLGAIAIYLLRKVVMLNLPVIGAFVREIMDIVEQMDSKNIY